MLCVTSTHIQSAKASHATLPDADVFWKCTPLADNANGSHVSGCLILLQGEKQINSKNNSLLSQSTFLVINNHFSLFLHEKNIPTLPAKSDTQKFQPVMTSSSKLTISWVSVLCPDRGPLNPDTNEQTNVIYSSPPQHLYLIWNGWTKTE